MRKVEPLPTRDCEAGYGPEYSHFDMCMFHSQLIDFDP